MRSDALSVEGHNPWSLGTCSSYGLFQGGMREGCLFSYAAVMF